VEAAGDTRERQELLGHADALVSHQTIQSSGKGMEEDSEARGVDEIIIGLGEICEIVYKAMIVMDALYAHLKARQEGEIQ
jgi:hypothetical protein